MLQHISLSSPHGSYRVQGGYPPNLSFPIEVSSDLLSQFWGKSNGNSSDYGNTTAGIVSLNEVVVILQATVKVA
jgi:hypothetical protein